VFQTTSTLRRRGGGAAKTGSAWRSAKGAPAGICRTGSATGAGTWHIAGIIGSETAALAGTFAAGSPASARGRTERAGRLAGEATGPDDAGWLAGR